MGLLNPPRIAALICAHNEQDYIQYCLQSIYSFADIIVVSVNTGTPWGGGQEPLDDTIEIVRAFPDPEDKLRIREGEWSLEIDERRENLDSVRGEVSHFMTVDADEIYSHADLERLRKYVTLRPFVGQFRLRLRTYWKIQPFYVIDPPEPLRAYVISRLRPQTKLLDIRASNEKWRATVPRRVAVCHHFSYARRSERIRQKLDNTLHKAELVPEWYDRVWLRWDSDHKLENLHPTHPEEYKRAIPVDIGSLPEVMREHPFARPD